MSISKRLPLCVIGLCVTLGPASLAWANEPPKVTVDIPRPESDRRNYIGDNVRLRLAQVVKRIDLTRPSAPTVDVCAPINTDLEGKGSVSIDKVVHRLFVVDRVPSATYTSSCNRDKDGKLITSEGTNLPMVKEGDTVAITDDSLEAVPALREGLAYGTLLVPFKYQLRGDKSFASRASLGGYLGYRNDRTAISGISLQFVGFVGATSISVTQSVNGTSATQELTGLTYGLGVLGEAKRSFQIGLVVGADRVSKSSQYVNNGKLWVAVSLGFAFAQ